jgi:hypothetical protein
LQLGVVMVALNERLPDAYKLLPPTGQPGPGRGRRSLRELVADRRAVRAAAHAGPPFSGLAEWLANRQRQAEQLAKRGRGGMRWLSGGWRRRWAPGRPTPTRPPATKNAATKSTGSCGLVARLGR